MTSNVVPLVETRPDVSLPLKVRSKLTGADPMFALPVMWALDAPRRAFTASWATWLPVFDCSPLSPLPPPQADNEPPATSAAAAVRTHADCRRRAHDNMPPTV